MNNFEGVVTNKPVDGSGKNTEDQIMMMIIDQSEAEMQPSELTLNESERASERERKRWQAFCKDDDDAKTRSTRWPKAWLASVSASASASTTHLPDVLMCNLLSQYWRVEAWSLAWKWPTLLASNCIFEPR